MTILERELGAREDDVISLQPINSRGWRVNSSFSNQLLYGFTAELSKGFSPAEGTETIPFTHSKALLRRLHCLQCRCMLLEWMLQNNLFLE